MPKTQEIIELLPQLTPQERSKLKMACESITQKEKELRENYRIEIAKNAGEILLAIMKLEEQ